MIFSAERNAYKSIAYLSVDGGKNWSPTLEVDRDLNLFDPACMFGPDGKAYFAAFGWEKHPGGKYEMFFYRSNDSGRTWMPPVLIPVLDREFITVDDSGGKYHGRIYVNGTGFTRTANGDYLTDLTLLRSADGGVSFESPLKLPQGASEAVDTQGNGVVLSDGTLVVLFGHSSGAGADIPRCPNAKLKVLVSNAGAERLGRTYTVGDWYRPNSRWVNTVPVLAVDRSTGVFRDRLYSVWTDNRSGRTEILFSYSSDSGKNWSKPIIVNDDIPRNEGEGPDNFMPAIAVNSSGVIGVSWYDRRDDPENRGWSTRFAASLDGGETFTRSVKVSEAAYSEKAHNPATLWSRSLGGGSHWDDTRGGNIKAELGMDRFYFNGGDTAGLSADANGNFHPFWIDNRTGVPQIWTTTINVGGKAIINGSAELAGLTDISPKTTLEFTNIFYNPKKSTISFDVAITNTSKEVLAGQIKARVLNITSPIGSVEIPTAKNNLVKEIIWDFSSYLPDKRLAPGATSKPFHYELELRALRPVKPNVWQWSITPLLSIEAKTLHENK